MINILWFLFIIIGIGYSLFNGKFDVINVEILNSSKTAFNMVVSLLPVLALWVGIMKIAQDSGLLNKLASLFAPLLSLLFPEIPRRHESLGFISSNIIANLFGLGNAATPFGLKAMESMQKLNNKKDTASRSMITFLVLNTVGFSIIPTTVIALRMLHNSKEPMEIVGATILVTLISGILGLIIDRLFGRRGDRK